MTHDELEKWFEGGSNFAVVFFYAGGEISSRFKFRKNESVIAVYPDIFHEAEAINYPAGTKAYLGTVCLRINDAELARIVDTGQGALFFKRSVYCHAVVVLRNITPGLALNADRCRALLDMGVDHVSAIRESMHERS